MVGLSPLWVLLTQSVLVKFLTTNLRQILTQKATPQLGNGDAIWIGLIQINSHITCFNIDKPANKDF